MANPSGSNQVLVKIYELVTNSIRVKVVNPNDFPSGGGGSGSNTSIAVITEIPILISSQQLAPADATRKGLLAFNHSASFLLISYSAMAESATATCRLGPNQLFEPKINFQGEISFISESGESGTLNVTELFT